MASKCYIFILLIRQIGSQLEILTEKYIFYINLALQFSSSSLEIKKLVRKGYDEDGSEQ